MSDLNCRKWSKKSLSADALALSAAALRTCKISGPEEKSESSADALVKSAAAQNKFQPIKEKSESSADALLRMRPH